MCFILLFNKSSSISPYNIILLTSVNENMITESSRLNFVHYFPERCALQCRKSGKGKGEPYRVVLQVKDMFFGWKIISNVKTETNSTYKMLH
jgi:hypothetical protein